MTTVRRVRDVIDSGPDEGVHVLVDRLWPRGIAKADVPYDQWCRDVAPSTELRRWYGHDPERFAEFADRYRAELDDGPGAEALAGLRDRAAETGDAGLTLLTATRDVEHSHARVLAELIDARGPT